MRFVVAYRAADAARRYADLTTAPAHALAVHQARRRMLSGAQWPPVC